MQDETGYVPAMYLPICGKFIFGILAMNLPLVKMVQKVFRDIELLYKLKTMTGNGIFFYLKGYI